MAKLEYFVIAESISVDQLTNRVSIFQVIEDVLPEAFPCTIRELVAVCLWNAEEGDDARDFQFALRVSEPDAEAWTHELNFSFPGRRHRTLMALRGLTLKKPGTLLIEALLNGKRKASHEIIIHPAEERPGKQERSLPLQNSAEGDTP